RLQRELEGDYNRLNTPPIERKADRDLSHALRVLDVIFREMNIAAVSPVVTFDVAQIGPGGNGARYALGGGVKLTVVTLDVTAGYAVTIHRQPGEPRGAFLFALDVSDLFR
ncbi:MAG TPA: hypothetical protein VNG89_04035, partial [Vicinamibacterales bacterium]|nr:hypothetical protein [Vicinamibacterales bacterium]